MEVAYEILEQNTVQEAINFLLTCSVVYFDFECGLDPYTSELYLLSLHGNDGTVARTFVVDIQRLGLEPLHQLRVIFEHPEIIKVAHNAVFDWKHLYHHTNIYAAPIFCTMIAEQVIQSGLLFSGFGLDDVVERRLGIVLDKSTRDNFIDRPYGIPFSTEELKYAALDAAILEPVYIQQCAQIKSENLDRAMAAENALIPITSRLEYNGVCIDEERLDAAKPVVDAVIAHATIRLQDAIIDSGAATELTFSKDGYSAVNVGSPKQMLTVLNDMGVAVRSLGVKELSDWDAQWARKNHKHSGASDDEFDVGYAHPVLRQHAIRTGAAKLEGTYISGLKTRINPVTRRIHPGYKQCGAPATGRMSSWGPNFQNLTNKRKLAALGLEQHDVRSMFIPAVGCDFIICDYSSIELAILAAMSGDERLTYEILRGDVHSFVTNNLIEADLKNVLGGIITEELRNNNPVAKAIRDLFKRVSFGIVYGSTGYNLYRTLYFDLLGYGITISQNDADRWVDKWKRELFPQTGQLLARNATHAVTRFYTESALGRRRHWSQDIRRDKWRMLAAEREGSNHPIQATCADMLKLSMIDLDARLMPNFGRIVAPVHDELLCESVHAYTDEMMPLVKYSMESSARSLYPDVDPMLFIAQPKKSDRYDK